ncbi:NPCBM/NEW2 domain-containing protein [Streptomyces desertarenae]|uniref:NPCBM/NEW2 domain-containing protein n=1 Tax=Streptomyces desertarenae TaxID=2666184 RepID=A0ABW4PME5_9ACTN
MSDGDGSEAARRALGRHLRVLFEGCGLSLRGFTHRYGFSPSAISRYLSGERLPRKAFLDALLAEHGRQAGAPLTEEARRLTFTLYRAALEAGGSATLLELYELELRLEELTAELERLRARATHPRQPTDGAFPGGQGEPGDREEELRARHGALLVQYDRIRAQIAHRESSLGDGDRGLRAPTAPPPFPGGEVMADSVPRRERTAPPGPSRATAGSRVPWLIAAAATVAAAVLLFLRLTAQGEDSGAPVSQGDPPAAVRSSEPGSPAPRQSPSASPSASRSTPPAARPLSAMVPQDGSETLTPGSFRLAGRDYPDSLSRDCQFSGDALSGGTEYVLEGRYTRFTATVGITAGPDNADAVGTFGVRVDGKLAGSWTATRDRTASIKVDLTGAERLTLQTVDLVGDPLFCKVKDFVWADPHLTPAPS